MYVCDDWPIPLSTPTNNDDMRLQNIRLNGLLLLQLDRFVDLPRLFFLEAPLQVRDLFLHCVQVVLQHVVFFDQLLVRMMVAVVAGATATAHAAKGLRLMMIGVVICKRIQVLMTLLFQGRQCKAKKKTNNPRRPTFRSGGSLR